MTMPIRIVLPFALASVSAAMLMTAEAPALATLAPQSPAASAAAGPQAFTIDDVHSMAMFRVQHMGAGHFWGRFNEVTGNFAFQPGSADGLRFDVTIKTESVDTGVPDLDKHLRTPDFFAVKDFPTMTFKSTKATKTGESTYDVMGELTMHGVTKPITAKVEFCGMRDMGRGPKAGFEATFTVKRSEFGVNYGVEKGAIGDDVKVIVGLEGSPAK
jgi:polyisoprenoid-binding protein YceI